MRWGDSVSTIHSLIYTTEEASGGVPRWIRKGYARAQPDRGRRGEHGGRSDLAGFMSFDIPILAVGDHGQLPPVGSPFNLMADPVLRLEQIFRQEAGSAIIEVATLAGSRCATGAGIWLWSAKNRQGAAGNGIIVQELLSNWKTDLLVLCGYNATRIKLNQAIREMRDMESPLPQSGDQVVCLRNNRMKHNLQRP